MAKATKIEALGRGLSSNLNKDSNSDNPLNFKKEKSTIDKTIISNDVKIDDLVHIGHNSFLGKATQVTVGSIICGRAKVGEKCWIAPNSVIDNGIIIGNNCLVGTGSLVRKNFGNNCVIVGSPAKVLRKFKK